MTAPVEQFPFREVASGMVSPVLMPYLPISLNQHHHSALVEALVDSGSVVNVLPYDVGLQLGLVWEQQTIPVVLSGNLRDREARGVVVTGTVGTLPPAMLAFAWTQAKDVPLLLGQVNFFLEFDVCFYRKRGLFEVRRAS